MAHFQHFSSNLTCLDALKSIIEEVKDAIDCYKDGDHLGHMRELSEAHRKIEAYMADHGTNPNAEYQRNYSGRPMGEMYGPYSGRYPMQEEIFAGGRGRGGSNSSSNMNR